MEIHYYRSRFYELIEKDLGKIDSICAAAGGRKGSLVRAFRTTSLQQHQSLEDKTAPRSSWPWGRNKE
jgi:histidyl-tRNA synthetase